MHLTSAVHTYKAVTIEYFKISLVKFILFTICKKKKKYISCSYFFNCLRYKDDCLKAVYEIEFKKKVVANLQ